MNVLKRIWNWVRGLEKPSVRQTESSPAVACEEGCSGEVFLDMLREAGISKHVKKVNGVELFEAWYDGPCTKESIAESLPAFKEAYPAVAAKMAGKL